MVWQSLGLKPWPDVLGKQAELVLKAGSIFSIGCFSQGRSFVGSVTAVPWLLQAAAQLLAKLISPFS